MKNYFSIKEIPNSLRNGTVLKIPSRRFTYYGTNSIHFLACLLWNKFPNTLKEGQSLPEFKYKIKAIEKIDCSCTINQIWTKIPKFVWTFFMDDPTAKRSKLKVDSIIYFSLICYMNKQPPVVFYKNVFLKIPQNLQENTPVEMTYF